MKQTLLEVLVGCLLAAAIIGVIWCAMREPQTLTNSSGDVVRLK